MRGKLKHTHGIENVLQSAVWHVLKLVAKLAGDKLSILAAAFTALFQREYFSTISAPGEGCRKNSRMQT